MVCFNVINEMYKRYLHLPREQCESIMLINETRIERSDTTAREKYLLRRINTSLYKLAKGDD